MARKPNPLSQDHEQRLITLMKAGRTAAQIADALAAEGVKGLSRATVGRRMRELRGPTRLTPPAASKAPRAEPVEAPLPSSPDAIPEGTDLEQIERWLETAERNARAAEADGNLAGLGAMGRLAKGLLEAKVKARPTPPPDPNQNPDMQKLGADVSVRFLKLIDEAAGTRAAT
jgi:hypothetical protein